MKYKMLTLYISLILLFVLCAASAVSAQNPNQLDLPDTSAGKRAAAIIRIIEQGDEATIRQFLSENFAPSFRDAFPMENHVAQIQRMQRELAGFKIVGVRVRGPSEIELLLRSTSGNVMQLSVAVESESPQLINGFRIGQGRPPLKLDFSSYEELDTKLKSLSETGGFAGVVLIAQGDKIAFEKAYGLADQNKRIPNQTDTMFDVGSISKLFTCVAVTRLAQEGRLNLDDAIGKYLKNLPNEIADKVTVRQLLQMRSGMGDFLRDSRYRENPGRFGSVSDYLEIIRTTPLLFEPGTSEAYSNTGYVALGAIIEAVTGRSYYDVIEDYVYKPAGMKSSGSFDRTAENKNMAIGYTGEELPGGNGGGKRPIPNTKLFAPLGSPAGGGFSTAQDLKRFVEALFGGKLLEKEYTQLYLNRYELPKENPPGRLFNRAGGAPGVNAVITYNPNTRDLVIVLANRDLPIAEEINRAIAEKFGK